MAFSRALDRRENHDQYRGRKQHGLGIEQVNEETLPESMPRWLRGLLAVAANRAGLKQRVSKYLPQT